jgi:hypothetical protein
MSISPASNGREWGHRTECRLPGDRAEFPVPLNEILPRRYRTSAYGNTYSCHQVSVLAGSRHTTVAPASALTTQLHLTTASKPSAAQVSQNRMAGTNNEPMRERPWRSCRIRRCVPVRERAAAGRGSKSIDVHVHVYDGAPLGIPADANCIAKGATTVVDAGSAGAHTLPGFRQYVVRS